ncbi:MAG: helix-turn-helix domain-containing protein [Sarcina sp.]
MDTFGKRLKELRNSKSLTQEALAENFYINKTSISRYENGTQFPELELLIKIADFFNVSLDYLLCRTTKKNISNNNSDIQVDPNKKINDFLKIANQLPNIKKLKTNLKNNPNHEWSNSELALLISYLDVLGINIPKILEVIQTHKNTNDAFIFDTLAEELMFIMEQGAELTLNTVTQMTKIRDSLDNTTKNSNGLTEYPL